MCKYALTSAGKIQIILYGLGFRQKNWIIFLSKENNHPEIHDTGTLTNVKLYNKSV